MRRFLVGLGVVLLALAPSASTLALPLDAAGPAGEAVAVEASAPARQYVVLYAERVSLAAARMAVRRAGGTIVKENAAVGVATVRSANADFLGLAGRQSALAGVVRDRAVGGTPGTRARPHPRQAMQREIERLQAEQRLATGSGTARHADPNATGGVEPLSALQWGNAMVNAVADGSYAVERGDRRVLVGVMDTGIDGRHPDLAPTFSRALSRSFTSDDPLIDGPCEAEPDRSCDDPVDVDENGHGTHLAGIIGAALNGLGTAGVAPNVTLVNLRVAQDSGYVFLQPVVDALVYAGDTGIDVVNMSFFIDPWHYNCPNHPDDSAAERLEQRTVIAATRRAVNYARARRVTLIASAGNFHTDLGAPTVIDGHSPVYPPGSSRTRTVDNTCLIMPTEAEGVLPVVGLGPSKAKADYADYGVERAAVSAPGGWVFDFVGTPRFLTLDNAILSTYPESLAIANGDLDPQGVPITPFVVRDCQDGVCAYYQYLQGSSMAAAHVTGVVALIISRYGAAHVSGLTMNPIDTERILKASAARTPCPEPRLVSYAYLGYPPSYDASCEGTPAFNGFYGHGIVDALRAVTYQRIWTR